ncbi:MAG: hypothetical protein SNF33_07365 [Candidatus Algichlamydia australiensis]|nr:hypothetical protein [Chlamydiales bacterium]
MKTERISENYPNFLGLKESNSDSSSKEPLNIAEEADRSYHQAIKFSEAKNYVEASKYFLHATSMWEKSGVKTKELADSYFRLSLIHTLDNALDRALMFITKASKLAPLCSPAKQEHIKLQIKNLKILLPVTSILDSSQPDSSTPLNLLEKNKQVILASFKFYSGKMKFEQRKYREAKVDLVSALLNLGESSTDLTDLREKAESYAMLTIIDYKQGNTQKAHIQALGSLLFFEKLPDLSHGDKLLMQELRNFSAKTAPQAT